MNFKQVISAIKTLAPPYLAEKWDNTGLLVEPSSSSEISIERIFLTIDLTEAGLYFISMCGVRVMRVRAWDVYGALVCCVCTCEVHVK